MDSFYNTKIDWLQKQMKWKEEALKSNIEGLKRELEEKKSELEVQKALRNLNVDGKNEEKGRCICSQGD